MNENSTRSTIWEELNNWGKTLPGWQRFIVSYAVRDGSLNPDRVNEAYRLFLREAKLDDGSEELPKIPNSVTGRADSGDLDPIVLEEVRSLRNVNAIPETSKLTFSPGLTVIYGHNGTGKSGFARILSSACFSRSEQKIIGNIYEVESARAPATAEIVIDTGNGSSQTVAFTDGDENAALQRISVFDASAAYIHLARENELGFQPAGFDVFDEVIRVVGLISKKLEEAIVARRKPNDFGKLFLESGSVATEISKLSADTDVGALRKLGVFGNSEQQRLDEVVRQENDALRKIPTETLRILANAKIDIESIKSNIFEFSVDLGEKACDSARLLLKEQKDAAFAAIRAGQEVVQHPNLVQTGSENWDAFVGASRVLGLAEKETYPEIGDPCLLCHRPLDGPSVTLIRRMWGFLDSRARQAALAVDEKINAYVANIRALELNLLPKDSRVRADLSKIDPKLVISLDEVSVSLDKRRDALATALENGTPETIPAGDFSIPNDLLRQAVSDIENQESALKKGKFGEVIGKLKSEHVELRQRQVLGNSMENISAYIADLKWIKKANNQLRAGLGTRFVTDKQRKLFGKLIEGAYKERLEDECKKLNCSMPVEFSARGRAGHTIRGLKARGGHKPNEIFSEGEQRALAIADFITEVNLNPTSAAIVLDDPVTSLDHLRKSAIARRLVEESMIRQVVVFTHDLVFLSQLSEHCDNADLPFVGHWVDSKDSHPGHVVLGETPANSRAYRSTARARGFLDKARKASAREKVDHVRSGAGALRRTIEEVVVTYLFKDVVRRWNENIMLSNIKKIIWSDDVADEIDSLLDGTSRMIEGHSNSDEFAGGMPDIEGLEKFIDRVDELIRKVKPERRH